MNRILFFILIVIIAPKVCIAQNMVSNPSFENVNKHICSDIFIKKDSIENAIIYSYLNLDDWKLISPEKVNSRTKYKDQRYHFWYKEMNTPFVDTCYIEMLKLIGYKDANLEIEPHSGGAYIRNWNSLYRTLFQSKLLKPIEKGKKYYVELYYRVEDTKLAYSNIRANSNSSIHYYFHKNLGITFSNTDYSDKRTRLANNMEYVPAMPFEMADSLPFKGWTKIHFVYEAKNNYDFVIIGNFADLEFHDENIALNREKNGNFQLLYWYFDDLKIIPYEDYLKEQFPNGKAIELQNIFFELNSYKLKPESFKILDDLLAYLSIYPQKRVLVNGYTDNDGNQKANTILSQKRANSIKEYLLEKGINAKRITTKGYGCLNPEVSNTNEVNKAKNRRIEIKIF